MRFILLWLFVWLVLFATATLSVATMDIHHTLHETLSGQGTSWIETNYRWTSGIKWGSLAATVLVVVGAGLSVCFRSYRSSPSDPPR